VVFSFFLSHSFPLSSHICERACLPYMRQTCGTSPREGKRRVPFVRTRACVRLSVRACVLACVRACVRTYVSARLAVTYIRARAYDLFLAGVSQPPDALFGTTRCHAPVPPLPSLAHRLALLVSLAPLTPSRCSCRVSILSLCVSLCLSFSLSLSLFNFL